jgi:threonine/homoserine/homoserine lactone efflux protein
MHVIAAAAGLSVVFHAVPALYAAVKLIGAAYLISLGVSMIRAKASGVDGAPVAARKTGKRSLFDGVTVEMLNPKTAMFFLAFLPQFTDPAASLPVWVQFMILGSIVALMFALADGVAVLLASSVVTRLSRANRVQRAVERVGGGILMVLGLRLALQKSGRLRLSSFCNDRANAGLHDRHHVERKPGIGLEPDVVARARVWQRQHRRPCSRQACTVSVRLRVAAPGRCHAIAYWPMTSVSSMRGKALSKRARHCGAHSGRGGRSPDRPVPG